MTAKRNLSDKEINIGNILEELSDDVEATYKELHSRLKAESSYKRLKRIGEEQFYNATSESSIEIESQNTRLCFAKINLLVLEVGKAIDTSIREKFQDEFHSELKDKVLKTTLKLYSEKKKDSQISKDEEVESPPGNSDAKQKKDEEKEILVKLKDLSKFCADNLIDIRKQAIEMPLEETEPSLEKSAKALSSGKVENLDTNNSMVEEENISFGSFSSVHTSELSSFDDELVFSSDEETGKKGKRMSFKAAEERLTELKVKKLATPKNDQNQAKTTKHEVILQSEGLINEFSSVSQKSLSQQVCKPNLKYTANDKIPPLRKTSTDKMSTTSPACSGENTLLRKRGRPKKHLA